jgi:hypothetical protein
VVAQSDLRLSGSPPKLQVINTLARGVGGLYEVDSLAFCRWFWTRYRIFFCKCGTTGGAVSGTIPSEVGSLGRISHACLFERCGHRGDISAMIGYIRVIEPHLSCCYEKFFSLGLYRQFLETWQNSNRYHSSWMKWLGPYPHSFLCFDWKYLAGKISSSLCSTEWRFMLHLGITVQSHLNNCSIPL